MLEHVLHGDEEGWTPFRNERHVPKAADGHLVQRHRAEVLAIEYGHDPVEVARLAQEIADADQTFDGTEPSETVSEGGSPGQRDP